jgi:eukaryotic-like serine/threonine-protein kinase
VAGAARRRPIRRRVAIKFVHAAWIGRIGEQRFLSEGKLLGRLDHPHVARLLDAGVLEATQPYLVLEYVDGAPIDDYCERRSLGTEARIRLFLDVLDAVSHAHTNLIVHRDLKPSNIFVTGDGSVKLLDFGIAKLLDEGSGTLAATQSIANVLTPQYAAPEQLVGQPVTTATDTYALGLVLYLLLSGSHPFADKARSREELIRAAATYDPPQASRVARLSAVPRRSLEGDLDNILRKSLKKDPAERYASAGAFAQDLRRFLDHMPVAARPDTLTYRAAKFVRRHRVGVPLSLLILAAILAGLVGTAWQARRADANANVAAQQREQALQQLRYAEAAMPARKACLESTPMCWPRAWKTAAKCERNCMILLRRLPMPARRWPYWERRVPVSASMRYRRAPRSLRSMV